MLHAENTFPYISSESTDCPFFELAVVKGCLMPGCFPILRHFTGSSITNASYAFLCELKYAKVLNRDV
jgi:hypothetical protein